MEIAEVLGLSMEAVLSDNFEVDGAMRLTEEVKFLVTLVIDCCDGILGLVPSFKRCVRVLSGLGSTLSFKRGTSERRFIFGFVAGAKFSRAFTTGEPVLEEE